MIIDNTYFIGEVYISHAKPSVVDVDVDNELSLFIDDYARDCLIKCLGYNLFLEFEAQLDSTKDNGLKESADEKWDRLLNGHSYTGSDGKDAVWRGIRFKSRTSDDKPTKSFLANFVYWYYERNYDITRAGVGNTKPLPKGAEIVTAAPKVTKAWNKFVELVQGKENVVDIYERFGLIGVDYYGQGGRDICLYKFIKEMNIETENYYENFEPSEWDNQNQMGI